MDKTERAVDSSSAFGHPLILVLVAGLILIAAECSSLALLGFAFAVLALMIVVRAWGRLGLSRLETAFSLDRRRFFPGETFSLRAKIRNGKALPASVRLEPTLPEALYSEPGPGGETGFLPFETRTASWTMRASKRGAYPLSSASLAAGDLLGLFRREKTLLLGFEVVVFPRLLPLGEISLPFRHYFGIHPSKGLIEDPAWYEGTREYSGLKPARNIHWKASARFGVLQEKIFEPTSHQKAFFVMDGSGFRAAGDEAGFESAIELLASLAARLAEAGASFAVASDCLVRGYPAVLPLGRGPEHLGQVLELLARCEFEAGQDVVPLIGGVGSMGSGFIIASRSPDANTKRYFSLPSTRRDLVLFLFAEGLEEARRCGYPALSFEDLISLETAKAGEGEEG